MSDLIRRSELLSTISNMNFDFGNDTDDTETIIEMVSEVIKEQLIAYSVDKVVAELQEFLINYGVPEKSNVHQRIIEIVKQGGVGKDDVCEWESVSDGEFIQNPHTKRLYSNEPSMKNVYCNTCGKKIRIVGD